ncbi:MAG: sel1 repeat family protein, partial [Holosporales bacterium]|nr:sel1 repeat family protein [Holosporales bacterium]
MTLKIICLFLATIYSALAYNKFINHYIFNWIETNPKVAEDYLLNSLSNPEASYILGTLYLGGYKGFPQSLKKADYFLTISANQNNPAAISSIGDGYYCGDIRKKNLKKALEYYEKAARLGFGPAQFNAGIILLNTGTAESELRMAIFWLDKASKNLDDLGRVTISAKKYKLY